MESAQSLRTLGNGMAELTDSTDMISIEAKQTAPSGVKNTAPVFTIGEAQSWYSQDAGIVRSSALREVIGLMINNNFKTEFENDSYLDALVLTEVMFQRANSSIRLFTGPSCEGFLQTLKKAFIAAVERLNATGGKIQILILSDKIPNFISQIKSQYPNTLQIALGSLKPGVPQISHFFVCDGKMARVEEPHPPLTQDTPITAVHAKIYFSDPSLANLLDARFQAFWNVVTNKAKAPAAA